HGWDLFLAVPAAMAVTAAVSVLIGIPALRIRGPFLAVTTLAFAVTSSTFFLDARHVPWFVPDFVPRPTLWNRVTFDKDWQMYLLALFGLVVAMAAARSLRQSRTGRALVAVRDNSQAAQSVSINTTRTRLTGFAVSGAIAGFAGSLYVLHQTAFKTDAFGPEVSLLLFSMVVIGGLGSLPGAILGAAYIRGAQYFLPAGWSLIASGAGIIVLLLVLPGGLGQLLYLLRDAFLRWVAGRNNVLVPSLVADMRVEDEEAPMALGTALGGLSGAESPVVREAAENGMDAKKPAEVGA
ncbi:MAG: branched-chain amino acid transport system permease protein livM, partial [Acidimicrobiaceae bacterium]|nr:branched-chain amino acid transport system permease protein livM [Acidimicrobiaceae bacterium]